jgi:hypothetical protein
MFARSHLLRAGHRAFSSTAAPATTKSLGLTLLGCSGAAFLTSEYILTDDRLSSLQEKAREMMGVLKIEVPTVHAFSTPDHGLHPAHLPWESDKWSKTYDHAA